MSLKIYTAPTVEPVTLQEAKLHLRLNSGTFSAAVSVEQSIAPGSHNIAAAYSLKGAGIDVSAMASIMAILEAGLIGSPAGAIDVKLQESNTDVDANYTDVSSGAFAQVTGGNDQATYELAYSGTKKYVRAVATVAGAACEFGVSFVLNAPISSEDLLVTAKLIAARRYCEGFTNRAYITQTWDFYLDHFPHHHDSIDIPKPPLQYLVSLKYKDAAGVLQTVSFLDPSGTPELDTDDYIVDIIEEPGRLVLKNGKSWPSTLDEAQAVQIQFVCGYGLAADVPYEVKAAILLKLTELYENRGDKQMEIQVNDAIKSLLWPDRIVPV